MTNGASSIIRKIQLYDRNTPSGIIWVQFDHKDVQKKLDARHMHTWPAYSWKCNTTLLPLNWTQPWFNNLVPPNQCPERRKEQTEQENCIVSDIWGT